MCKLWETGGRGRRLCPSGTPLNWQCIVLTCTGVSISTVSGVARAGITPLCVSALCILMTVVGVTTLTLIDICVQGKNATNLPNQLCTSNWQSTHQLTIYTSAHHIQSVYVWLKTRSATPFIYTVSVSSTHLSVFFIWLTDSTRWADGQNQSLVLSYCACGVITTYFDR